MIQSNASKIAKKSQAEREAIQVHTASLEQIVGAIKPFNAKVVNKRMVDAVKAAGIHVSWSDNWQDVKEMTLHHGYSQQAGEYADFYRTVTVPLVIRGGRLDFVDTEEAIAVRIGQLQDAYKKYAFEQVDFDAVVAEVEAKMKAVFALIDTQANPYVRDILQNRARRGY